MVELGQYFRASLVVLARVSLNEVNFDAALLLSIGHHSHHLQSIYLIETAVTLHRY